MKEALQVTRRTPEQKYEEITRFSKSLFNQQNFKQWGVQINVEPEILESIILPTPTLI